MVIFEDGKRKHIKLDDILDVAHGRILPSELDRDEPS